jgi:hypothetical protein
MNLSDLDTYQRVWGTVLDREGDKQSYLDRPHMAILTHADLWASRMEKMMEDDRPLTAGIISDAYHQADAISQLSSSMDNAAAIFIKDVWEHGAKFKEIIDGGHSLFLSPPWEGGRTYESIL